MAGVDMKLLRNDREGFIGPKDARYTAAWHVQGLQRLMLSKSTSGVVKRVVGQLHAGGWLPPGDRTYFAVPYDAIDPKDRGPFIKAVNGIRKWHEDEAALAVEDPVWEYLRSSLRSCKRNAGRRNKDHELTEADILALYVRSGGCCEVSGVRFHMDRFATSRAPFAPSIDRICNGRGYLKDNVRLVCQIANLAMNVWGEDVLRKFVTQAAQSAAPRE